MAPEQLFSGTLDARSDIFSFALVGLEALTGFSARRHESLQEVMSCSPARWARELELINSGNPQLDRHFAQALSWSSEERPESALRWAETVYGLLVRLPARREWLVASPGQNLTQVRHV
jgi:hypothetical protein